MKYVYILSTMKQQVHLPEAATLANMAASCVGLNVRKAARAVTQLYDGVLQPSGLRIGQFGLLAAVALVGEPTLTRLAEELVMDRTTLTRNLAGLQQAGLVSVQPDVDRRVRLVAITPLGRRTLRRAIRAWRRAQSQMESLFGGERLRSLIGELETLAGAAAN